MSVNAPTYLTDGLSTALGGVDESRQPLLLQSNQVSRAINMTFRGGFPRTRPPFAHRSLRFARAEYGRWFISHRKQGEGIYDDFRGMEKTAVSIGGRIFLISPTERFLVTDITPRRKTTVGTAFTADSINTVLVTVKDASRIWVGYPIYIGGKEYSVTDKSGNILTLSNVEEESGTVVAADSVVEYLDANSPDQPLAWIEQAEEYLVIQDDQNAPIIFDGGSSRRARTNEIPTGSAMAYGQGRLWIAVSHGREFVASDIAGGPTGVLGFTENTFLAGGGAFLIPANAGRIRAMKFVANLDTSLGQGPLQVMTDRAVFSVNAPTSRELWSDLRDPIQTVSLINFGATSQASTVLVNGDLFFRSHDGLRSFVIARRDFGMWGNTPVSREMSRLLDSDTPELLDHCSAVLFDNRLLFTVTPLPGANGVRHKGIVALDFDVISAMREKSPPAYDGLWTGVQVTGMVAGRFAGRERCFLFTHDNEGMNDFWELLREGTQDSGAEDIDWVLESRSLPFPRPTGGVSGLKRMDGAEAWISEFSRTVTLSMKYRPDQHPCWQEMGSKTICITDTPCGETDACESSSTGYGVGYKTRIGFGMPADAENELDEQAMRAGFSFQFRLEGSGFCQLNRVILWAHEEEEWMMAPPGDDRSQCGASDCCPEDPYAFVSRCFATPTPIITPVPVIGAISIQFSWIYQPGATYTLFGQTVDDGEIKLAQYPLEDSDWVDPDGWYVADPINIAAKFPTLSDGDEVQFWIRSTLCGRNEYTDRVTFTYTI